MKGYATFFMSNTYMSRRITNRVVKRCIRNPEACIAFAFSAKAPLEINIIDKQILLTSSDFLKSLTRRQHSRGNEKVAAHRIVLSDT